MYERLLDKIKEPSFCELAAYCKDFQKQFEAPVYILMGDNDCDVMTDVAENYFENINAPDKMMKLTSGGHFAPMINYEDLSEFVHEVAKRQQQ